MPRQPSSPGERQAHRPAADDQNRHARRSLHAVAPAHLRSYGLERVSDTSHESLPFWRNSPTSPHGIADHVRCCLRFAERRAACPCTARLQGGIVRRSRRQSPVALQLHRWRTPACLPPEHHVGESADRAGGGDRRRSAPWRGRAPFDKADVRSRVADTRARARWPASKPSTAMASVRATIIRSGSRARVDLGLDLGDHLGGWDDLLALEMAAALGKHLVLDLDRVGAGALQQLDGAHACSAHCRSRCRHRPSTARKHLADRRDMVGKLAVMVTRPLSGMPRKVLAMPAPVI